MIGLIQDCRYAVRTLVKNPGFAAVAVVTLALGIGSSTAIFSVVDGVLLHPLAYAESEDLALVWTRSPGRESGRGWASRGLYETIRDQSKVFDGVALLDGHSAVFSGGAPERVRGITASVSCLPLLGAKPALGRLFLAGEDDVGKPHTLVLSHALWTRRFGADPGVIGSNLRLDDDDYTVVGVLEEGFSLTREHLPMVVRSDYWVPLSPALGEAQDHVRRWYGIIAKLGNGATFATAQTEMRTIASRLKRELPDVYRASSGFALEVVPFVDYVVGSARRPVWMLFGAVALVMLIVCTNVAGLLLVRARSRQKEIGVRVALGAGRRRVVRQLLVESVLLSLLGGALGLLVASWGLTSLLQLGAKAIPRADEVGINYTVAAFTFGLSLLTSVVFGLVPALTATKVDLNGVLRQSGRSVLGVGSSNYLRRHLHRHLVIGEIALSLVLLIGAGLLVRSFYRLQKVDAGFSSERVLSFQVAAVGRKYANGASVAGFYSQLPDRIANVPGVESVGGISIVPFGPNYSTNAIQAEGHFEGADARGVTAESRAVLGNYFKTMEIPLLSGRHFNELDTARSRRVAIIDESFVKRFWPEMNPIGKRFRFADSARSLMTVVGVVGTTKQYELDSEPRITFYQPHSQCTWEYMYLLARTASDPSASTKAIANEIWAVDPDMPLMRVATMDQRVSDSLAKRRFTLLVLGAFAVAGLILAVVGLYGVVAYTVGERTQEIGVRMALGAQSVDVLRLVLQQGFILTVVGIGVGSLISLAGVRVLSSELFEVSPADPLTFASVAVMLTFVALIACYIPARRATKVDPMIALRCE